MSHRKVYSQGNIPFSWEDKPGISKLSHQNHCPNNINTTSFRVQALDLTTSLSKSHRLISDDMRKAKIPPPPCPVQSQPPNRTGSGKGLEVQADPFLLALKECTKPPKNGKPGFEDAQYIMQKRKKRIFNIISFSCKGSRACSVENDNVLVNPQRRSLPRNQLQTLMNENW